MANTKKTSKKKPKSTKSKGKVTRLKRKSSTKHAKLAA
jgi:hypothetical protein